VLSVSIKGKDLGRKVPALFVLPGVHRTTVMALRPAHRRLKPERMQGGHCPPLFTATNIIYF
jgi:hypothetical protein